MNSVEIKSNKNKIIKGPLLIKPKIYYDGRGYFFESWNKKILFDLLARDINFVQDNHSESKLGVLRGLHYQVYPKPQAKLVRCTKGAIYDVLVDLRISSETFGEWCGFYLNDKNKLQLWIPEGFAHGFLSLKNYSQVQYKTNEFWDKTLERSLKWNDKELEINWPNMSDKKIIKIITNDKDSNSLSFNEIRKTGDFF